MNSTKNNKILLLDFSNIAHATRYVMESFKNDFDNEGDKLRYWKAMMLNSIKKNKRKHAPDEFVICVDSRSWRKVAFKFYKAQRDQMKKDSNLDFIEFIEQMTEFVADLERCFPYKVIRVNGAEADDIIAILALELKTKFKKVIIASNDKDFSQLVNGNVHLWNIAKEKFVQINDSKEYLIQHILTGDPSDGIPNVRSDDDTFIDPNKRQKPCGPKMIGKILEMGIPEWLEQEGLKRNWRRNRKLIELSQQTIPSKLWVKTLKKYNDKEVIGNFSSVMQYFTRNRMRQQLSEINFFM